VTIYPFVIDLHVLSITGFGLMMMFAFIVAGWIMRLDLEQRGLNPAFSGDIIVAGVIGGIVGAKLWYVLLTRDPAALFTRGGLVWYGGFIGGVIAVLVTGLRHRVPPRWTMQVVAPALAAAYAVGRVGCFLVGDDYGGPSTLPWAVKFPEGLPPSTVAELQRFGVQVPPNLPPSTVLAVHPTQIYETLIMLGVFAFLWSRRRTSGGTGAIFGLYLMFAGAERFFVEILRAKDDRFLAGFTIAQLTSVVVVLVGAVVYAKLKDAPAVEPGTYLGLHPVPQPATAQ
jgi:phosphatidylglycerol---prolipoprotein diacylglyceryl transferase